MLFILQEISSVTSDDAEYEQAPAGIRSTLDDRAPTSNLSVRGSVEQDVELRVQPCAEVQDVPVMLVRLPAKTQDFGTDHPDPIHNETCATFDQNNRNHPPSLGNWSLLALSPLRFLMDGSC